MIKYALVCDQDHEFESWFPNADAFDTQARRGFVECPVCRSTKVTKALMAPAISTSRRKSNLRAAAAAEVMAASAPASAPDPGAPEGSAAPAPPAPMALLDEKQREMREMIRSLHQKLTQDSTDVGDNFPREARAMHDGDAPHRSIHGKATFEEARALAEDGIPVLPLPPLPDERN